MPDNYRDISLEECLDEIERFFPDFPPRKEKEKAKEAKSSKKQATSAASGRKPVAPSKKKKASTSAAQKKPKARSTATEKSTSTLRQLVPNGPLPTPPESVRSESIPRPSAPSQIPRQPPQPRQYPTWSNGLHHCGQIFCANFVCPECRQHGPACLWFQHIDRQQTPQGELVCPGAYCWQCGNKKKLALHGSYQLLPCLHSRQPIDPNFPATQTTMDGVQARTNNGGRTLSTRTRALMAVDRELRLSGVPDNPSRSYLSYEVAPVPPQPPSMPPNIAMSPMQIASRGPVVHRPYSTPPGMVPTAPAQGYNMPPPGMNQYPQPNSGPYYGYGQNDQSY